MVRLFAFVMVSAGGRACRDELVPQRFYLRSLYFISAAYEVTSYDLLQCFLRRLDELVWTHL